MHQSPSPPAPSRGHRGRSALVHLAATLLATGSLALGTPTQTDDAQVLLSIGDILPGNESILRFADFRISDEGLWAALVYTDGTPTLGNFKEVLLRNGDVMLSEGDVLGSGDTIRSIRSFDMSPDGFIAVTLSVDKAGTGTFASGLWVGGGDLLIESGPISGAGIPAGTLLTQILDTEVAPPVMLVAARLLPPGNQLYDALLRFDYSVGPTPTITLEAISGQTVAPFTDPVESMFGGLSFEMASDGSFTLPMILDVSGQSAHAGAASGTSVYIDGGSLPVPNFVWDLPTVPAMRGSSNGRHVVAGTVRNTVTGQELSVILENGIPRVVEGAPISGTTGDVVRPFTLPGMSYTESGEVFYEVPLGTATSTLYRVLMVDSERLIQTGVSTASGHTITGFTNQADSVQASANGAHGLFLANLSSQPDALCALERNVGYRPGCLSEPNSTGVRGKLRGDGSSFTFVNDLTITAYDLPQGSFGYLNTSTSPGFIANPGGSVGNLCIVGSIGRYVGQVQSSGSAGTIATSIDLTAMPQPTGFVSAAAGETWGFQLWHRDSSPGGAVSNWSNPRAVLFR